MADTKPVEENKAEAAPEVGQMKRGDYMIHVFIEQARQIKCPEGNTVDPLIEVQVMNEKKYTTAKDDIGSTGVATWNEHLFFEPKNVKVEDIESAKIQIKVLDKGYFKDAVIGSYDFDVAYVYFMEKHSLMHRWLALSNPSSPTFDEVTGYLKISITVAATGDEQVQITEQTGVDNSEESIMMAPSIKPEYYQIKFRFFRAEKLPAMDKALIGKGSIDAYIICNYLQQKLKTPVLTQKEGSYIDWNQEFLIPCQLPIMSSRVVMKLYDEDKICDEIVGSLLFNLKDCIGARNGQYFWKNVYGSPLGYSGENTKLMNNNPEMGSTWKGRILIGIAAEKTEKPVCQVRPIEKEEIEKAQAYLEQREYEIIAEVGQGIALPSNEKYQVMIKIGENEFKTGPPAHAENTYNRWSHRIKQTIVGPYTDIYDIGKVFVYLCLGDTPICFWRADIEEFKDPNPQFKWIQLSCDLAVGKVSKANKAGIISFKLSIHDKKKDGPINFESFDAWKKPPPKRLNVKVVRCYLFQCRDLPAADSDGASDPYIAFWDSSKDIKKTKIIENNLNPMFFEIKELNVETSTIDNMPPFVFDVWDHDSGPVGDDYICRCVIPISQAAYSEDDVIPKPKWHPCAIKPNAPPCGEILVSFSIVDGDFNFKSPLKQIRLRDSIDTQEFEVDVNILGFRELQSAGILPVKKAFAIFNLKSLVPPEDGTALENIKTQPSAPGNNPTINTLISFKIPLSKDPLFCPRLACTVHDYIFKGFSQPKIGQFVIPIGELIHKLIKERKDETEAIDSVLSELDKIMVGEGVQSYSIQQNSPVVETFAESFIKGSTQIKKAKKSIKVDDEMREPLLLSSQEDVILGSPGQSPTQINRITPRQLQLQSQGTQSKNVMKSQQFDKFAQGMKTQLLSHHEEEQEKQKRDFDDNRKRDEEQYKNKMSSAATKNVIHPQYQLDTRLNVHREVNIPPDSLFIGLGWDKTPDAKIRHYRRYYPDELENIKEVMPVKTPFDQFDIKRGQSRGDAKGMFSFGSKKNEDGSLNTEQVVGRFKGIVTVQSDRDRKDYQERKNDLIHNLKFKLNQLSLKRTNKPIDLRLEKLDTMEGRQKFDMEMQTLGVEHLKITQHLTSLESDESLKRLMLAQNKCIVRLYMISAYDLASRDFASASDPYLLISLGNKKFNDRDKYVLDEANPVFGRHYDFEATFPGCPPLVVNVMDYDDIFGDDSIGVTSIDLEDRFFSPEWQSVKNKPIEYRQLYHPSSSVSQGVVKLWVEINSTINPDTDYPIYDITPRPPEEFEIRVCILDTEGIKMMDIEGTSDVYCRGFFDSRIDAKETDTHYRCTDGKASFNYRLLYKMKHPSKDYTYNLQVYDRDFFKSNDIIGDATIDLKLPILDSLLSGRPLGLNKAYYNAYLKEKGVKLTYQDENTFWLPMSSRDSKTGKVTENGKVRVQIDIYPKAMAEANKVGEARQEPNHSPFLPPPVGRISFSFNPIKMFNQMVGPALRRKLYCYCCMALCLALCIMLIPLVFGNLISQLFSKMIGIN